MAEVQEVVRERKFMEKLDVRELRIVDSHGRPRLTAQVNDYGDNEGTNPGGAIILTLRRPNFSGINDGMDVAVTISAQTDGRTCFAMFGPGKNAGVSIEAGIDATDGVARFNIWKPGTWTSGKNSPAVGITVKPNGEVEIRGINQARPPKRAARMAGR